MKIIIFILLLLNFIFTVWLTYTIVILTEGKPRWWEVVLMFIILFFWPISFPLLSFMSKNK